MARMRKRGLSLLLALLLLLGLSVNASAAVSADDLTAAVTDTAQYMYKTVKTPQMGSIGGEWAMIGLARSGYTVPDEYYQDYYAAVEAYVKACKGVLHEKKYTEYHYQARNADAETKFFVSCRKFFHNFSLYHLIKIS